MPVDCTIVSLAEYAELKRFEFKCKCRQAGVDGFLAYLNICPDTTSLEDVRTMAKKLLGDKNEDL